MIVILFFYKYLLKKLNLMLFKFIEIFGKIFFLGILYFFCVIVWVEMEEDEEYLREELEDGFYYVVFIIILFFVVEVYVYFFCYIMIKFL